MIGNRELSMDDYLGMLRLRLKVILLPALLAPAVGYLVSMLSRPNTPRSPRCWWKGKRFPKVT